MQIQIDRACIPAGIQSTRYLHVTISATATKETTSHPAVSVSLVLDRSGSMDGTKITMAREAVSHAIKLLKPSDYLALACYDEQITTVLDHTPATSEAKKLAQSRLSEIDARGSTDLHGGW